MGPELDEYTTSDGAINSPNPDETSPESLGSSGVYKKEQSDVTLSKASSEQSGMKKTLRRRIRKNTPIQKEYRMKEIQLQKLEGEVSTCRDETGSSAEISDAKTNEKAYDSLGPRSHSPTLIPLLSTNTKEESNAADEREQANSVTNRGIIKKSYNNARNNHRKIAPTMDMLSSESTTYLPLLSDTLNDKVIFSVCSTEVIENTPNDASSLPTTTQVLEEELDNDETSNKKREALCIQRWYRGFLGRRITEVARLVMDKELEDEAWAEIQSEAVITIQALLRAYNIRKRLSGRLLSIYKKTKRLNFQIKWPDPLNLEPKDGWESIDFSARSEIRKLQIRVFCGTWNLHAKLPTASLQQWITRNQYHIIAIGSEECGATIAKSVVFPSKKLWQDLVQATLGASYTLVASHALAAIHNMVFVHHTLLPLIRDVQSDAIATGIGNQLGNKGGVGIAFSAGGTSFAFVNAHFEAHQHNVEKRNASFHKINTELRLQPVRYIPGVNHVTSLSKMRTSRASVHMYRGNVGKRLLSELFDRVFWYGDLNYRINGTRKMVDTLIKDQNHAVLYFNDQLQREMRENNVFPNFHEGPLNFLPTYKFDKNSDQYDSSSKQRIPSWTDRVLYLSNENHQDIEVIRYTSEMQLQSSDHRPVTAVFLVNITLVVEASGKSRSDPIRSQNATKSRICMIQ